MTMLATERYVYLMSWHGIVRHTQARFFPPITS